MGCIFHWLHDIFLPECSKYGIVHLIPDAVWFNSQHRHPRQKMVPEMAFNTRHHDSCLSGAGLGTPGVRCGILLATVSPP